MCVSLGVAVKKMPPAMKAMKRDVVLEKKPCDKESLEDMFSEWEKANSETSKKISEIQENFQKHIERSDKKIEEACQKVDKLVECFKDMDSKQKSCWDEVSKSLTKIEERLLQVTKPSEGESSIVSLLNKINLMEEKLTETSKNTDSLGHELKEFV